MYLYDDSLIEVDVKGMYLVGSDTVTFYISSHGVLEGKGRYESVIHDHYISSPHFVEGWTEK